MNRLQGKVCVITGAGGGMGADAAHLFTEEGAQVCVADVDLGAAEKVAGEVGGLAVQVNVAEEDSVRAMYAAAKERFGGIDVLYNNAGISPADDDSILDTDLDAWERVHAELATEAALLEAAERRRDAHGRVRVDGEDAGVDRPRDA